MHLDAGLAHAGLRQAFQLSSKRANATTAQRRQAESVSVNHPAAHARQSNIPTFLTAESTYTTYATSLDNTFAIMKLVRYVTVPGKHARKPYAERLLEGGARNDLTDRMMQIPHEVHQRDRHSGAQDR